MTHPPRRIADIAGELIAFDRVAALHRRIGDMQAQAAAITADILQGVLLHHHTAALDEITTARPLDPIAAEALVALRHAVAVQQAAAAAHAQVAACVEHIAQVAAQARGSRGSQSSTKDSLP